MIVLVVTVVAGLAVVIVLPRVLMARKMVKLNDEPAPTPHKASAKRIRSGARTILYFYTPTCPACRTQDPMIRRIRKRYPHTVFRIDSMTNHQSASAYGVVDVPHFAFIEGGKLVMTQAGSQREATLVEFLSGTAKRD